MYETSDIDENAMEDYEEYLTALTESYIEDSSLVFNPEDKKIKNGSSKKAAAKSPKFDRTALERKYKDIPRDGMTWSQLENIQQQNYNYAVLVPEPEYDIDGNIIKYNKKYVTKWGSKPKKWDELRNGDDYGVIIDHPHILVDIDDELEAKILFKYVVDNNIKCLVMRTNRGLHFWFNLPSDFAYEKYGIANKADVNTIGGLIADYRVNGKGLACLKFRGEERKFIYGCDFAPNEWDTLPFLFYPQKRINSQQYEFVGLTEGSRDNLLNDYKAALYGREGLSMEDCASVLAFINDYLFVKPLDSGQMCKFGQGNSYKNLIRYDPETEFYSKSKFLHEKCAAYLNEKYHFIPTDNKSFPLIYKDGYYQQDDDGVEIILRQLVPELTSNQVQQVQRALHILATKKLRLNPNALGEDGILKEDPYWINLKNGRLNMLTGEFCEHSPEHLDTQRVPVFYNPEAKCEAVDMVLDNVFEKDKDKIKLFYEIMGTCLTRDNHTFTRSFYYVGEGSNGKSTIIRMQRAMIGVKNISCIKPGDMKSNSFNLVELHHKLANIVEELSATDVNETDIYKQVVSGDAVSANRKYLDPVVFHPYATVIYAMNKIPNFTDKSLGMTRRYEVLTFTKNFNKIKDTDRKNFDPHIADKITTEEAKSYLLNKAVAAYKELMERGEYTIPESSKDAKEDYLAEENPVTCWIDDNNITAEEIVDKDSKFLYSLFKEYQLNDLGYSNPWMYKTWKAEIIRHFSEEIEPVTRRKRLDKSDRNSFKQVFTLKAGYEKTSKESSEDSISNLNKEIAESMGFGVASVGTDIPF